LIKIISLLTDYKVHHHFHVNNFLAQLIELSALHCQQKAIIQISRECE